MNLTDEELPSEVENYNLKEVGLYKSEEHPVRPLIIKVIIFLHLYFTIHGAFERKSFKDFKS